MGGASSGISGSGGSSVSGIAGSTISGDSGNIKITSSVNRSGVRAASLAAESAPVANTTVANANGANLRAFYSTKEMQLSEIVGAKNAFKPDSPELPYLILPANGVVSFNPGEGLFATVLVVDASTPSVCAGTIAENFQVRPGSSVIITASRKIVPRKSDQDNEWVDEDGNNHKTA